MSQVPVDIGNIQQQPLFEVANEYVRTGCFFQTVVVLQSAQTLEVFKNQSLVLIVCSYCLLENSRLLV